MSLKKNIDKIIYRESEIERIAALAFELAAKRGGRLTSVDKANVLEVTMLWREVVDRVGDREFEAIRTVAEFTDVPGGIGDRDPEVVGEGVLEAADHDDLGARRNRFLHPTKLSKT